MSNGYDWDISLKSVKIAKPISIKKQVKNPETKKADKKVETKVKQVTNAGRKQMINTASNNSDYSNKGQKIGNSKTKPRSIMQRPISKRESIDITNPGKARNKMLSTLTSGTEKRVTATASRSKGLGVGRGGGL